MNQLDEMRKLRMLMESTEDNPSKNKCKSCDKACTKTYCSKACKDKVNESKDKKCTHTKAWHKEGKKCSMCGDKSNTSVSGDVVEESAKEKEDIGKFKTFKNPGREVQDAASKIGGFKYIKGPSNQVKKAALRQNSKVDNDVVEESMSKEKKCKGCKKTFDKAGKFCSKKCENKINEGLEDYNGDEEEQLKAVQQDGLNIKYIDNPSEKVQLAAVEQNPDAAYFISNPCSRLTYDLAQSSSKFMQNIRRKYAERAGIETCPYCKGKGTRKIPRVE